MMTVAVCLFKAGTTKGAAAMVTVRYQDEFDEMKKDGNTVDEGKRLAWSCDEIGACRGSEP